MASMVVHQVHYPFPQFVADCVGESVRDLLPWDMSTDSFEGALRPAAYFEDVVPADRGSAGAVAIFLETRHVVYLHSACLANCLYRDSVVFC